MCAGRRVEKWLRRTDGQSPPFRVVLRSSFLGGGFGGRVVHRSWCRVGRRRTAPPPRPPPEGIGEGCGEVTWWILEVKFWAPVYEAFLFVGTVFHSSPSKSAPPRQRFPTHIRHNQLHHPVFRGVLNPPGGVKEKSTPKSTPKLHPPKSGDKKIHPQTSPPPRPNFTLRSAEPRPNFTPPKAGLLLPPFPIPLHPRRTARSRLPRAHQRTV